MRVTPATGPEDGCGARQGERIRRRRFLHDGGTKRVDTCNSGSAIADHIRLKVIYEGLELEEIGIDLDDITDDVLLFDADGLNLDSIDALEILAGVQREFGLSLPNVDQAFMEEHCTTVERLARMVMERSPGRGPGGQVRNPDARTPVSEPGAVAGSPAAGTDAASPRTGSSAQS